jgi:hypothetical protein
VVRGTAVGLPVVVHCSDPRFQPHFQDFLRSSLSLDHYALIAVPGGPQLLTRLPRFSRAGWPWMKFMTKLTRAPRIILIVHDDCRWYLQRVFGHDPQSIDQRMVQDAGRVRASLLKRFGRRRIEIYAARLRDGRASFEPVV